LCSGTIYGLLVCEVLSTSKGIAMESDNRRLMWHGVLLFLLGLVTGLLEQHFTNIRMGSRRTWRV
jgi:hypothetical protein